MKAIKITFDYIEFDNGYFLSSEHEADCCEEHYLDFLQVSLHDFDGLIFDLNSDSFFERVKGYGIRLIPINGHPISIPAYSQNNGYYSDELMLVISDKDKKIINKYDITECNNYSYED